MGGHVKFQIDGCYIRDLIKKDTTIFDSVTAVTKQGGEKLSPNIKTGDRESRVEISKDPDHSTATFSYPIDTDPDPVNGRLYMEDQFVFDREKKTLEKVHRSFRMNAGAAGAEDWAALYGKLNKLEDLDKDNPTVQKFFKEVVLNTPEPSDEPEAPKAGPSATTPTPSSSAVPAGSAAPVASSNKPPSLLDQIKEPAPSEGKYAAAVDDAVSRFMQDFLSPTMLGSVLAGSAAFRLGEGASFQALKFIQRPWLRRTVSTLVGVGLEAPAFEYSARGLSRLINKQTPSWDQTDSAGLGVLRNFVTFGALRGSYRALSAGLPLILRGNGLFLGRATVPVLSGVASFGTLHGINELERAFNWRPGKADYKLRVIDDVALTLQVGALSFLLGRIKPGWPRRTTETPSTPPAEGGRSSRPPSIPPTFAPLILEGNASVFHNEIEGLAPKLEDQYRQGFRVVRIRGAKGYHFVDQKGNLVSPVNDETVYRNFRLWRELARYEEEGMPGVLDELKTYRKGAKERTILEDPKLTPTARVRVGQNPDKKNFYMGPIMKVADEEDATPNGPGGEPTERGRSYALALVPEFNNGEMELRRALFYKLDPQAEWEASAGNSVEPHQEILNHLLRFEAAEHASVLSPEELKFLLTDD